MVKMYFMFIIVMQMTQMTNAVGRNLLYVRLSESASLSGLGCALDKLYTERARGARFNPQTKACESLLETWFTNKVEETGFDYFKLKNIEDVFEPSGRIILNLPTSVVSGYRFMIRFNSGTDILLYDPAGIAQIMINLGEENINWFRLAIRTCIDNLNICDIVTFNDGSIPNPVTLPNTTYKLEGLVNSTHIQVFMDDVHIYDFAQTTDLSNYERLAYKGRRGANILQCIQYYPD